MKSNLSVSFEKWHFINSANKYLITESSSYLKFYAKYLEVGKPEVKIVSDTLKPPRKRIFVVTEFIMSK